MTETEQFLADAKKIIRHERADNGGRYDGLLACRNVGALLERYNRSLGALPQSVADYWQQAYVVPSADAANEPSEANLHRLAAFHAFLSGDGDDEWLDALSHDDFCQLQELVNCEAADLPLEALEAMMAVIVAKGAL